MEEKDTIESKIDDGKEKVNEKVNQGRIIADKVVEDLSKGMDEFVLNLKTLQKIADGKFNEYKQKSLHSLDLDLIESESKYFLKVAVPGVTKKNIDIEAGENDLTIICYFTNLKEELKDDEDLKYLINDLKTGKCLKKIKFENEIDIENIQAKFSNGIVYITINKIEELKYKVDLE